MVLAIRCHALHEIFGVSFFADRDAEINIAGRPVFVRFRRNRRARRIILRLDIDGGDSPGVVVTLPPGASRADGLNWATRQHAWIARRLDCVPLRIVFADGVTVPFIGADHIIRHAPGTRRGVWREAETIMVSGRPEHLARRLSDWLRREARREISELVAAKASAADLHPDRISIRDTRSRWGSCAASGNLNFSWRLILAPDFVLDYVVAHEAAHLRHANHGDEFWRFAEAMSDDMAKARTWLKMHGEALHRYG